MQDRAEIIGGGEQSQPVQPVMPGGGDVTIAAEPVDSPILPGAGSAQDPAVIIGGGDQAQITRKAMIDAGADARFLMENSRVVSSLVSVDIITRQLFILIRTGLDVEIKHAWTVEHPDLVIQTLGLAAQEKAVKTQPKASDLRALLLTTVLPVVDIFCKMEAANDAEIKDTPTTLVPGDHDQPSGELATVHGGTCGDTVLEAGECGEGDRGETGQAS